MTRAIRTNFAIVASLTFCAVVAATAQDGYTPAEPGQGQPIVLQSVTGSERPAQLTTAAQMLGFSKELGEGAQAITLIDASRRWMAVYHIDSSGQIRLTSSRPLDADFSIQFNASSPLPEEIRRLQGK